LCVLLSFFCWLLRCLSFDSRMLMIPFGISKLFLAKRFVGYMFMELNLICELMQ
jgi:hypothetical protein